MCKILSFFNSTIGLKFLMALSGIALSLFLVAHAAGNLIILVSEDLYNQYAYALTSKKLVLYSAEAGLLAAIFAHMFAGIKLSKRNKDARPQAYAVKVNSGRSRRAWWSSHMLITGVIIAVFVVLHLLHFKWGDYYETTVDGVVMRDLSRTVIEAFSLEWKVAAYVGVLVLIMLHLLHGFRSTAATTGLETDRSEPLFKLISKAYVVVVFGSFIIIPIAIYVMAKMT